MRAALTTIAFVAVLASACDTAHTVAPQEVPATANTPAAAVQRMAWAFSHRDLDAMNGLLTEDFVFSTPVLDSAGNVVSIEEWTREQILATFHAIFTGEPGVPAAAFVQMNIDPNLVTFSDTRPGRNGAFHRAVRTGLRVSVALADGGGGEAEGHLVCFMCRGDSALISPDELARGARADSTRWWIDRIEDETIGPAFPTLPRSPVTFGDILRLWHHGPSNP